MAPALISRLIPLLGATLLAISGWVLAHEVGQVGVHAFAASLAGIPPHVAALAVLLTAANYLVLTWHDQLAFRYVGVRMRGALIGLASFVGYAISNNVGFALISGTSARYRFYARWGVSAADLSRIVLFYSTTFWIGLCLLGGGSLLLSPPAPLRDVVSPFVARGLGGLAVAAVVTYAGACLLRRAPIAVRGTLLQVPSPRFVLAQVVLSSVDWLLASAVVWVLVPAPHVPLVAVTGAFAVAQIVALGSHVPGGLGVFEGLMVVLLRGTVAPQALVPALLAYRLIYYLLPLATALAILLVDELLQRRQHLSRWSRTCRAVAGWAAPTILSVFTFLAGAVLLLSGATPGVPERMAWLARIMPLPLLEASHFTASLAGLMLLLLAKGLADRVDAAWYLSTATLALGAATSMLKGADYEEALLLTVVLGALVAGRRHFVRRARALDPLTLGWLAAASSVVASAGWLTVFAARHEAYRVDDWWQFAVAAEAPRSLRAMVAVTIAVLVIGIRTLLRPTLQAPAATTGDGDDVEQVVRGQARTSACLAFLGDKSFLWNDERTAFVMYAVRGGSRVAMGDPVGPDEAVRPLIARFQAMAHRSGLSPVFYEASREHVADYADAGLIAVKVGEEARVHLTAFSVAGSRLKPLRTTLNRMQRDGFTFEVLSPEMAATCIDQLADISDEWLDGKSGGEKGFSLGSFSPGYVTRGPVAVIRHGERIEAFANLWTTDLRDEVSLDLMRYRRTAFPGVMDALFTSLMLWARGEGYTWFNLGMAPLAGLRSDAASQAWTKVGHFLYRHGEAFYNFQGLRAYKDKFDPDWSPRYLVYGGALGLPRAVADVTALVSAGYGRALRWPIRRSA